MYEINPELRVSVMSRVITLAHLYADGVPSAVLTKETSDVQVAWDAWVTEQLPIPFWMSHTAKACVEHLRESRLQGKRPRVRCMRPENIAHVIELLDKGIRGAVQNEQRKLPENKRPIYGVSQTIHFGRVPNSYRYAAYTDRVNLMVYGNLAAKIPEERLFTDVEHAHILSITVSRSFAERVAGGGRGSDLSSAQAVAPYMATSPELPQPVSFIPNAPKYVTPKDL